MQLFLMRHADAEPAAGDDFSRRLTEKGRKQAEKMGGWLKSLDLAPILFLASPYPRAHETAAIVADVAGKGCATQPDERLASGMTVETGCAVIHELGREDRGLCLVGHSPDLDRLAAHLVGSRENAVEMKKGAVAAFATVRAGFGGSLLKWLVNPKLQTSSGD